MLQDHELVVGAIDHMHAGSSRWCGVHVGLIGYVCSRSPRHDATRRIE